MHIDKSTMAILAIQTTILSSYTRGRHVPCPFASAPAPVSLWGKDRPFATSWHINTTMELGFVGIFISIRVRTDGVGGTQHERRRWAAPLQPPFQSDGTGWGVGTFPQPHPCPAHPALTHIIFWKELCCTPCGRGTKQGTRGPGFPPPTCHQVW